MLKSYNLIKSSLYVSSILIAISLLSGFILSSSSSSADVVDDVVVTVPVSCNMASELDEAHTATINPGQYQSDIGTTNFTVFCNDNSGYAIYAIGYSNEEYGNTKMLATINNELSPANDINTGINVSGSNSSWSMKLVPVTTASSGTTQPYTPTIESDASGSFANYHAVPAEYTKVATFTSNTDFTIGSSLQSTYQVYIDGTKPAGTYAGKVKYTLVHPNDAAAPTIITPPASCTTPVPGLTYMQDLNSSNKATILNNMTEDSQYYLADKRDDKTYCVAKLKDGNLWMTQNLDHDIKTDGSVIYDNTTTDLGWNGTSYTTASWSPASATKATSDTTWTTDNTGYTIPESYDPGELYWNGTAGDYSSESDCTTAGGTWDSTNNVCNQISSTGDSHYHLGNYYNWTAAVAMNYTSSYTTKYTDVNQSICPAGWTLPKSGSNTSSGSFQYLFEQYGWSAGQMTNPNIWNTAIKLPLSGYWYGSLNYVGRSGYFWLSVVYSSDFAYCAYAVSGGVVYSGHISNRDSGNPVRCVAR